VRWTTGLQLSGDSAVIKKGLRALKNKNIDHSALSAFRHLFGNFFTPIIH
jgi:hypothetical protein